MNQKRWHVRGVAADIIEQVQHLHYETAFTLGQIVTAALRIGLPSALEHLRAEAEGAMTRQQAILADLSALRSKLDYLSRAVQAVQGKR